MPDAQGVRLDDYHNRSATLLFLLSLNFDFENFYMIPQSKGSQRETAQLPVRLRLRSMKSHHMEIMIQRYLFDAPVLELTSALAMVTCNRIKVV
jgi:hypothetical protein